MTFQHSIFFITILFLGLVAGLFYSYSCSVNPGLAALPDKEYLMAMQSINEAIQNPWFFAGFMGTLILLPLSCWQSYGSGTSFYIMIAVCLIYYIAVFGVTVFGNVPLNNQLAAFTLDAASSEEFTDMRSKFEKAWNNFNLIRTVGSLLAFALSILSLMSFKKG